MSTNTPQDPAHNKESLQDFALSNRLVNRLSIVVFLEWLGAGALLPLLPLYLRDRGASPALVGLTVGSFFLAGL